jgi:hypothetical protein
MAPSSYPSMRGKFLRRPLAADPQFDGNLLKAFGNGMFIFPRRSGPGNYE